VNRKNCRGKDPKKPKKTARGNGWGKGVGVFIQKKTKYKAGKRKKNKRRGAKCSLKTHASIIKRKNKEKINSSACGKKK